MIPGSGSWSYCQRIILTPARPWPWHLKHWHKKDVCRDQDKWYHLNILPFVSNKSSIIINQFCEAFVKVGSRRRIPRDGVNIEQIKPFNANDVDDNTTNTTIDPLSLNTFQPPISNIHHIPLTIGNMSYVQRTIACAISITMFFSWNLL